MENVNSKNKVKNKKKYQLTKEQQIQEEIDKINKQYDEIDKQIK